jgi:FkbM family methyltransferase
MLKALFYPDVKFETLYIPYIYREIYFEGVYIDIMNSFKGHDDKVIVDIGANLGIVTQYMRDYAKKVYAVEPDSKHFEALSKNKEFNKWDNVEVFNMAIADQDGEMTLNKFDNNLTCNSLINNYNQGGEVVKTQTFNTFFKKNNIDVVDFCKFDVEGAEEMILCAPGFADIAPRIKSIMVEFHYPSFPKIVDHMIDLGFKARRYPSSAVIFLFER